MGTVQTLPQSLRMDPFIPDTTHSAHTRLPLVAQSSECADDLRSDLHRWTNATWACLSYGLVIWSIVEAADARRSNVKDRRPSAVRSARAEFSTTVIVIVIIITQ